MPLPQMAPLGMLNLKLKTLLTNPFSSAFVTTIFAIGQLFCFCIDIFRILSRWSFFVNIMNGLKWLIIFTKKLHLRCFTRFCVCLCPEVTSSIYQMYKFKVYCNSFWRHCNVFDVVFSHIKETLSPLSNVTLYKHLSVSVILCLLQIKNNYLYHVSKEDVKMLVLFRCWVLFVL